MSPTLDLRHNKIMVAPPRINLRRTSSYTHDRPVNSNGGSGLGSGPLSSTSSRFSFNHLLFASPPPSPGLPQLLPQRRRRPAHKARPSRVLRALATVALLALLGYAGLAVFGIDTLSLALIGAGGVRAGAPVGDGLDFIWPTQLVPVRRTTTMRVTDDAYEYELVGKSRLPDHATPVLVRDYRGRPKWTVSIPPNAAFPLAPEQYVDMCAKCAEVARRAEALRRSHGSRLGSLSNLGSMGIASSSGSDDVDRNFIDVHEAELAGFLPGSVSIGSLMRQHTGDDGATPVCERSLTFVLASNANAGIGRTLLLLWMAYAQAQDEGRGFFVDDTNWGYGKYTKLFAPAPTPACRPPLRHEMLACPRQARHLVVTPDTARTYVWPRGNAAAEEAVLKEAVVAAASLTLSSELLSPASPSWSPTSPPTDPAVNAHLFALARRGYEALFHLTDEDARHVTERVATLRRKAAAKKARTEGTSDSVEGSGKTTRNVAANAGAGTIVGVHVRRGDRRPLEYQYRDSYVPLHVYVGRAHAAMQARTKQHGKKTSELLVLASDDPMVYSADEMTSAERAQEHIQLASKAAPSRDSEPRNPGVFHKFEDETFGWEGGFFAAMFWNLGRDRRQDALSFSMSGSNGGSHPTPQQEPPLPETLNTRNLVGRSYLLDLAVLSSASDTIVCAVSATGCRLLAVMQGWTAAIEQGRWINVDGDSGWWAVD